MRLHALDTSSYTLHATATHGHEPEQTGEMGAGVLKGAKGGCCFFYFAFSSWFLLFALPCSPLALAGLGLGPYQGAVGVGGSGGAGRA
jgi:hypothetical protein